jgi:hypothetical protein
MTSLKKGYEGNYIATFECDSAGTLDAGTNVSVSQTLFSGGVEGGKLYASKSKGLMSLTEPTQAVTQVVGFALEADKYFFNPSLDYENKLVEIIGADGTYDAVTAIWHLVTDAAGAIALSDGVEGQRLVVILKTDAGTVVITPTNFGQGTDMTFVDVSAGSAELIFSDGEWWMIGGSAAIG